MITKEQEKIDDAGILFAMEVLKNMPNRNALELEAHITGVLVVFWGALWGSFGTEYAKGFIENQLRSMEQSQKHERFTPPNMH